MRFYFPSVLVPICDKHSERRFPAWLFLACLAAAGLAGVSILGEGAGERANSWVPSQAPLPSERSWAWLATRQNPDGSFGSGKHVSREVVTAYFVGLAAASDPRQAEAISMLDRAVAWLVALPAPASADSPETSRVALRVLALAAERDRRAGHLVPDVSYVESLDLTLFAAGPETGTGAILARALAPWSMAQAALQADGNAAAKYLRDNLYRSQLSDGRWASSPEDDDAILESASTLRTLHLLDQRIGSGASPGSRQP